MHPLTRAVPLALAVGLVAVSPAAAAEAGRAPVAHASGGAPAGPPIYPGLVNTRLVRTQKALDRAVDYADDGNTTKAISSLYTARLQVKLAWRAEKYVIQHAPPPAPAGDGLARSQARIPVRVKARAQRKRVRAHKSGGAVAGSTVADQYTTGGGVLDMQHTVAQTALGMIDTAHGTFRDSLSRTIFTALDQRDAAVAYIHSIDTPPPPAGAGLRARASGAPVATSGWAATMSPIADEIDDEINQIEGALGLSTTLGIGVRRTMQDAEFQDVKTQRTINQLWPPAPPAG
jgi:hypothetical protein